MSKNPNLTLNELKNILPKEKHLVFLIERFSALYSRDFCLQDLVSFGGKAQDKEMNLLLDRLVTLDEKEAASGFIQISHSRPQCKVLKEEFQKFAKRSFTNFIGLEEDLAKLGDDFSDIKNAILSSLVPSSVVYDFWDLMKKRERIPVETMIDVLMTRDFEARFRCIPLTKRARKAADREVIVKLLNKLVDDETELQALRSAAGKAINYFERG